jgi:O-antigen ligase
MIRSGFVVPYRTELRLLQKPSLGDDPTIYEARELEEYFRMLTGPDSHNTYVSIASEMGTPALALFLLILFIFTKNAWTVYRRSPDRLYHAIALGYLGGMVGLLVCNIFGSRFNTNEVSTHFWIMSAVIMRLREMVDQEMPRNTRGITES